MSPRGASSLVLGSRNPHKVREMSRLLGPAGIEVLPLPEGIELPPEVGLTFSENALPKARTAAAATGSAVDRRRLGHRGRGAGRSTRGQIGALRRASGQ